jgi:hypothetical protein
MFVFLSKFSRSVDQDVSNGNAVICRNAVPRKLSLVYFYALLTALCGT